MDMIPGMGGGMMDQLPDDAMDVTQDRMRRFERIMDSMTDEELEQPRVVGQSRTERIARGSGTDEETVRQLLEQHSMMEQTISQFQGMGEGDMQRMMKKMGGGEGRRPRRHDGRRERAVLRSRSRVALIGRLDVANGGLGTVVVDSSADRL